jgi:aminoglycoside 6'-N-acetyltransferase
MPAAGDHSIRLRIATLDDVALLDAWDVEEHVISATTDDPTHYKEMGEQHWPGEIALHQPDVWEHWIAELQEGAVWRPIGAMQMCDPHLEPTHYWGEIEPNLRALDIWIGLASDHGKGYGETMMRLAFQRCFAHPAVAAIMIDPLASNTRAHKFYQRLGFVPEGRRMFEEDDCLVHRLTRAQWCERFPFDSSQQVD